MRLAATDTLLRVEALLVCPPVVLAPARFQESASQGRPRSSHGALRFLNRCRRPGRDGLLRRQFRSRGASSQLRPWQRRPRTRVQSARCPGRSSDRSRPPACVRKKWEPLPGRRSSSSAKACWIMKPSKLLPRLGEVSNSSAVLTPSSPAGSDVGRFLEVEIAPIDKEADQRRLPHWRGPSRITAGNCVASFLRRGSALREIACEI